MGISFNGPDGIKPNKTSLKKGIIKDALALPAFKPLLKFANDDKQNIVKTTTSSTNFESRHSENVIKEFQKLSQKFENVEFKKYHNDIPTLEIGDDFIEDIPIQETCEV